MQGELLQIGIGEYLSYGSYCNQVLNEYFINIFLLNTLLSLAVLTYYAAFWISTCYFRIHAVFNYIWQASEISFRCIENILCFEISSSNLQELSPGHTHNYSDTVIYILDETIEESAERLLIIKAHSTIGTIQKLMIINSWYSFM